MKIKEYGIGLYFLLPKNSKIKAQQKKDRKWFDKNLEWVNVTITSVMLRATEKGGYYIIKYIDENEKEERNDCIRNFKVENLSLKSYLINQKGEKITCGVL